MLSGITSYFFGASSEAENETSDQSPKLRTTTDENNEWVLVDKASRDSSVDKSSCSVRPSEPTRVPAPHPTDSPVRINNAFPVVHDTGSDSGSDIVTLSPGHRPLDESWLVTPPPCFTAGGHSPEHVEENPLENLLIEHPSMSVYGPRGRQASTGLESEHSESSTDSDMAAQEGSSGVESRTQGTSTAMVHHPPRRPRAVAARAGLDVHVKTVKSAQVSQQRYYMRSNCRNHLARQNKVYHKAQSRRARHRDQLNQPHCKSSNRRC